MRYRFKGLKEYVKKLERLSSKIAVDICVENAVTEGSKVVSEMTLAAMQGIPTDDRKWVSAPDKRKGIRTVEKQALISVWGVSPLDHKSSQIDRKTGVDRGINKLGKPNITVARNLEHGTSYMNKYPVFSRASRKARTPCLEEMQNSLNRDIEKLVNNQNLQRSKI